MVKGSFGSPSTASDGIHEMDVTDDSIRMGAPFAMVPVATEPMPLRLDSQGVELEVEQCGHRSGTRVDSELLVGVLQVLPNSLR